MTLKLPENADEFTVQLVDVVNSQLLVREPWIFGWRADGGTVYIRFRASYAAPWVIFHVQTDAGGEGGDTYNSSTYKSRVEHDCRDGLVKEVSTPDVTPTEIWVWLIPVQYDGNDTQIVYDGEGGRPDNMVFFQASGTGARAGFLDVSETDFPREGTYLYYGGNRIGGDWAINRFLQADLDTMVVADESNNGSYQTLAAAWPDRATLTYA
jgi:hypothetical protein